MNEVKMPASEAGRFHSAEYRKIRVRMIRKTIVGCRRQANRVAQ
jgi:hypothetical protein